MWAGKDKTREAVPMPEKTGFQQSGRALPVRADAVFSNLFAEIRMDKFRFNAVLQVFKYSITKRQLTELPTVVFLRGVFQFHAVRLFVGIRSLTKCRAFA